MRKRFGRRMALFAENLIPLSSPVEFGMCVFQDFVCNHSKCCIKLRFTRMIMFEDGAIDRGGHWDSASMSETIVRPRKPAMHRDTDVFEREQVLMMKCTWST